jgi:hypothetical protein
MNVGIVELVYHRYPDRPLLLLKGEGSRIQLLQIHQLEVPIHLFGLAPQPDPYQSDEDDYYWHIF